MAIIVRAAPERTAGGLGLEPVDGLPGERLPSIGTARTAPMVNQAPGLPAIQSFLAGNPNQATQRTLANAATRAESPS
jgi:hypothetical protein